MDRWTLGSSKLPALMAGHSVALWEVATRRKPESALENLFEPRFRAKDPREDAVRRRLRRRFGQELEGLHIETFEAEMCMAVRRQQEKLVHPTLPLHATVDGIVLSPATGRDMPWEAKVPGNDAKIGELVASYHAQLTGQCMCLDDTAPLTAVFSVMWRTPKWDAFAVSCSEDLADEIAERVELLGWHVRADTIPPAMAAYAAPAPRYRHLDWHPAGESAPPATLPAAAAA